MVCSRLVSRSSAYLDGCEIGDWVVTPRIGKPVEIRALWLNALKIASRFSPGWKRHFERGLKSFQQRILERRARLPVRMSLTLTTKSGEQTPPSGPINSCRLAACRSHCSVPNTLTKS